MPGIIQSLVNFRSLFIHDKSLTKQSIILTYSFDKFLRSKNYTSKNSIVIKCRYLITTAYLRHTVHFNKQTHAENKNESFVFRHFSHNEHVVCNKNYLMCHEWTQKHVCIQQKHFITIVSAFTAPRGGIVAQIAGTCGTFAFLIAHIVVYKFGM